MNTLNNKILCLLPTDHRWTNNLNKTNQFLRCGQFLFFPLRNSYHIKFPPFFECFTYARIFGSQSKLTVLIAFAKIWHMSKHFIVKSNQMNVLGHTV